MSWWENSQSPWFLPWKEIFFFDNLVQAQDGLGGEEQSGNFGAGYNTAIGLSDPIIIYAPGQGGGVGGRARAQGVGKHQNSSFGRGEYRKEPKGHA